MGTKAQSWQYNISEVLVKFRGKAWHLTWDYVKVRVRVWVRLSTVTGSQCNVLTRIAAQTSSYKFQVNYIWKYFNDCSHSIIQSESLYFSEKNNGNLLTSVTKICLLEWITSYQRSQHCRTSSLHHCHTKMRQPPCFSHSAYGGTIWHICWLGRIAPEG